MKKFSLRILLPTFLAFCLVIVNTTNEEKKSMPDISAIDGSEAGETALEKAKGLLTNFFQKQIDKFSNLPLSLLDSYENLVEVVLDVPDFNLLNIFTDLNGTVTFKIYTNESGDEFHILEVNNETALNESNFDANRPTYIITHGWSASSDSSACTLVRYALQNTTDSNIIAVNWSPLADGSYSVARLFVPRIAKCVGELINILYENGMNPETTTLIGHSLGAHIMGIAGQIANAKVNHTIGLDPAWPLFFGLPDNDRLSPDDALYVEVIHTNAGLLGFPTDLGDYDFYPNGGTIQAACTEDIISGCSHGMSYKYLAEQISNPGPDFCSLSCTSYSQFLDKTCTNDIAYMGGISYYPANKGTYYLDTNSTEPYSLTTGCA